MSFGSILKNLRTEKGITQKELGDAIGKSNRVISYYENEQSESNYPDNETMLKIAKYFNVTINYLMELDDNKTTPKIQLVNKLIESTINRKINWNNITPETNIPYGNINFDYNSEVTRENFLDVYESYTYKDYAFAGIDYSRSYICEVPNNINSTYYALLSIDNNDLLLIAFAGENSTDIVTIYNNDVNKSLNDLLEIIKNINNNSENKLIKNLMDNLDEIDELPF